MSGSSVPLCELVFERIRGTGWEARQRNGRRGEKVSAPSAFALRAIRISGGG